MSTKKQNKPSKNAANNNQIFSDTFIVDNPKIFEYLNKFKIHKKHLLLEGGNKKELPSIRKYIYQETINRKLVKQHNYNIDIISRDNECNKRLLLQDLNY